MTAPVHFLVPGDPDTPTGGFEYDRHAVAALRAAGMLSGMIRVDGPFPDTDDAALADAAAAFAGLPDGAVLVVDGLALTPLFPALRPHAARLRLIALIHHPLADETGLAPDEASELLRQETAALATARRVVVTSRHTARRLRDLDVPAESCRVVQPGAGPFVDLGFRDEAGATDAPRLLSVATLVPRKGQDLLVESLGSLRDRSWSLDLVGDRRDPAYAARVGRAIAGSGLDARIRVHGAVPTATLETFWRRADLFVLASRHEGFGIVCVEAVRWGLGLVTTTAGAISEAVPDGCGLLVAHDDPAALRQALADWLDDAGLRRRLADAARHAAPGLRRWSDMAADFVDAVSDLP